MSHLRIWLIAACVLLVVSNAMWAARLAGETTPTATPSYGCTETEQYAEIRQELVGPIASAINASLKPGATKQSIVAAATSSDSQKCIVSSDTHIGSAGLRFSGDKLVGVSTMLCTQYQQP
jgi:hypothetical protein